MYIRPGVYGEVTEIRAPSLPECPGKGHNTSSDTIVSVDTTDGHNKSLEFNVNTMPSGPSMMAATRRLRPQKDKTVDTKTPKPRRSPRKRKILNYKDFVGGFEGTEKAELTFPKSKKSRAPLKGPSRTRMAAQKKIQAARTRRPCSPPPPTRITSASSLPLSVPDTREQATTDETEAAQSLLSLSMDTTQPTTDETIAPAMTNKAEIEPTDDIRGTEPNEGDKPPVAFEVNVIINPDNNEMEVLPGDVIGSAIKEEIKPVVKKSSGKTQSKNKTHFRMKSYSLKRKPDVKRKFKCRICPEILDSVHKYNYHY